MVKPKIDIYDDLKNKRIVFTVTYNGKSASTYLKYNQIDTVDPYVINHLITLGWNARTMYDDEAQKPKG